MKTQIKIFTGLIMALSAMPALAESCPKKTSTGTYPDCKCIHPRDEYSVLKNTCAEWLDLRGVKEKITTCVHKNTTYGTPETYHHVGQCFVFGDENISRVHIRALVNTYNGIYDQVVNNNNPGLLIGKTIEIGTDTQVKNWTTNDQPSVKAIIAGYTALCKRNGSDFDLKKSTENGKVSYVCQGTEKIEPLKISTETTSPAGLTADTSHLTSTTSSSDKGSTSSGNTSTYTVSVKGVDYPVISPATNTRQKIESIVNRYNNTYSISPTDEFDFSDMYKVFFGTKQSEPSIIAVNNGYKTMCKDLQDKHIGGIATTHWLDVTTSGALVRKRKCIVDTCISTHEKISGQCHEKNNQVHSNDQGSANGTNIQQVVQTIQSTPATVESTVTYPKTDAKNNDVKKEIKNWKEKCKEAVKKALGSISVESDYIEADYDSATNSLKCRIKKCADPTNTHLADDKKSCVPNEDKSQQSRSATTNAGGTTTTTTTPPQTNGQTTVTQEEVTGSGSGQQDQQEPQDPTISVGEEIINAQKTDEEACRFEGGTWNGTTCVCEDPTTEEWDPVNKICIAKQTDPVISVETENLGSTPAKTSVPPVVSSSGSEPDDCSTRFIDLHLISCCEAAKSGLVDFESPYTNCTCKNPDEDFIDGDCIPKREPIERLRADIPEPAKVDAKDVNISVSTPDLTDDYVCEHIKNGKWNKTLKKCYCGLKVQSLDTDAAKCPEKASKTSKSCPADAPWNEDEGECVCTDQEKVYHKETNTCIEKGCDDQDPGIEHIITEHTKINKDEKGNVISIETTLNYKSCDNLVKKWKEMCPKGTNAETEEEGTKLVLKCVKPQTKKEKAQQDLENKKDRCNGKNGTLNKKGECVCKDKAKTVVSLDPSDDTECPTDIVSIDDQFDEVWKQVLKVYDDKIKEIQQKECEKQVAEAKKSGQE